MLGVVVLGIIVLVGSKLSGGKPPLPSTAKAGQDSALKTVEAQPPLRLPPVPTSKGPEKATTAQDLTQKAPAEKSSDEADVGEIARKAHEEWVRQKELERAKAIEAERETALAVASSSTAGTRVVKETIQVPVGPGERKYFSGFTTPMYSQAERMARYTWLQTNYPYEDEFGKRYKIIQKTEPKEIERTLAKVSFINKTGRQISDTYIVISRNPISGGPESLPKEDVFVKPVGTLEVGQEWSKEAETPSSVNLNYYLILPGVDEARAFWIPLGGAQPEAYFVTSNLVGQARQFCDAVARAAEDAPTNWRQDKVAVATRYVQTLLDNGTLISAKRQAGADTVADIAFEFTFKTEAGFTRTRLGYVYVEPMMDQWTVRAVNIDGRRLPAKDW